MADHFESVELVLTLADLPEGSMRMARVGGHKIVLIRTSTGVHALDHACPHEGYGLIQGQLSGDVLTCAWHNWKFDVPTGACVLGEEAVVSHEVTVGEDGRLTVTLTKPDPEAARPRLVASLRDGIEQQRVGQVSRDVIRLLRADTNPGELVWEAVSYGAPRAEFGWGHAVASAVDCLVMVDLYDGDARALPVVQAIAGIAESERGRPVQALPDPVRVPDRGATEFRRVVEAEDVTAAQALVLGAVEAGLGRDALQCWFTGAVSDHHLSYGHAAIYAQKAFQLLDRLGWDRAATVLAYLVPAIVYGTREDTLPYMRPFVKALASVDLAELCDAGADPDWDDGGVLLAALLDGGDRATPLAAAVTALREGSGIDGVLDCVALAASERMLRYDVSGEFDFHDDFGWLDITHGLTYANAARWHAAGRVDPDVMRLALWTVFQAHWTGRHEWHTGVHAPDDVVLHDVPGAHERQDAPTSDRLRTAGETLQRTALLDGTSATIVHAHAVKTTTAATAEAVRLGSERPLQAAQRFLDAPKLERFVAANVTRSIDFLAGRTPRD